MQNGYEFCLIFCHQQFKVTHVCIFSDCGETSRNLCDKCQIEQYHNHPNPMKIFYHIKIQNFQQFIEEEKVTWIDLRLKSQDENQAKLKYISKILDENFDDLEWFNGNFELQKSNLERVRQIIQDLIKEYKYEIVKAQYLNDIYKQLTQHGQESLDIDQFNILLDNHCKHMNQEMEYQREINKLLNKINMRSNSLKNTQLSLKYQTFIKLFPKLRKMNKYLYFQEHSTNGTQFLFKQEQFFNRSFSSESERYFAMVARKAYYCNYLKIRKQNDLLCAQSLYMTTIVKNIKFDPQFNRCIIQDESNTFYHYILRSNKQLKLIQKFSLEIQVEDFFLSKQNDLIILKTKKNGGQIIVIKIYIKNVYINEIEYTYVGNWNFKFDNYCFCYGRERSIIAVQNEDLVQIYQETQKRPFIDIFKAGECLFVLMLVNKDTQLLTITRCQIYLWNIEQDNQQLTLINKIQLDRRSEYFLTTIEFNIIKSTNKNYDFTELQIFDNKCNQCFKFKIDQGVIYRLKFMEMTKHFLILSSQEGGSQIIKRKNITENERFEDDY